LRAAADARQYGVAAPGSMLQQTVQQGQAVLDAVLAAVGHQQHHILHVSQYFTTYTYHPGLALLGAVTNCMFVSPGV
jgi:hypothetical protein